ncbi:SDR family NAD(P)-dependent oxidoreductase [Phenylobacterium sp.]|uniref:SDR family NAD(P)-dependent oxidoreductase n=1 Tax=Phenylobacterium sp. TaxID=1871053 RepID=UPI0025D2F85B|nr:SDR family NAD(P)-dependent oxidoreductase [Phenylobacterium sp.]
MDIHGRSALVSGAAAGIGRATAVALAEKGAAKILLVDIDEAGLKQTAQLVEGAGTKAVIRVVDVTDSEALAKLFGDAEQDGGLDIVFNNAGILSGPPAFPDTPLKRIQLLIAINFTAVLEATWHAIQMMKRKGGGGVIINTSSTGGLNPYLSDAPYAATKAGVLMFSRSCGPLIETDGIRVNAVCPGVTNTPILAKTGGDKVADWLEPLLAQIKVLQPEDIADAVLGLIEDDTQSGEFVVVQNERIAETA